MNSDVSSDYSDDESFIQPSRETVRDVFNEKASKGWATCADGFEKHVKIKKNGGFKVRQKLAVTPSSSLVNTKDKASKTVHRKKSILKKCDKTVNLEDIGSCQASKENVRRDPLVTINNPSNYCSPITDFCLDFLHNESAPKLRKSKNWTFTDLSNSFSMLPDQKKTRTMPLRKKKMSLENDLLILGAIKCSSQLDDINVVETDYESPCSSQKEECSEVISFSPESSLLQAKGDNCEFIGAEKTGKRTVKNSKNHCNQRYQNSVSLNPSESSITTTPLTSKSSVVKKGSDWLKGIAWHKKENDDYDAGHTDENDISKHRKFVPGGFAEQVSKLEKKERSSRLIWSHKKREKSNIGSEKCVTIRVGPFHTMCGMLLSKCIILKPPPLCDEEKPCLGDASHPVSLKPETDLVSNPLQDRNLVPDASGIYPLDESTSKGVVSNVEHCFLLLKPTIMHDFKFGIDSTIRIYPPWQFLHVPKNPYPFILGAYFIEVLEVPVSPQAVKPVGLAMEEILFMNNYNDSVTHKTDIPVQTPVHRKARSKERKRLYNVDIGADIRKYLKKPEQDCVKDSGNTKVVQTSKECEMSVTPIVFDNVSENVNRCGLDYDDSVLESYSVCATIFSLCARVQRVWQYANSSRKLRRNTASENFVQSSEIRYSLLIQDRSFRFFELQLLNFGSISDNDSWNELLHRGEGQCFMFNAVKISRKLCLSKYPALFTLLKTIGGNQQAEKDLISARTQPTLCYQLTVNCRNSTALNISDHMYPPYAAYAVSSLDSLIEMPKSLSRFSCFAKVLCEVNKVFYITDKSVQKKTCSPYIKMSFCSSGVQPASMNSTSEILITEAVVQENLLFVDKYSMVIPISFAKKNTVVPFVNKPVSFEAAEELSTLSLSMCSWNKLHDSSNIGDLVKVQGKILSVNADTAISWLECSVCGKENLYQDARSRIFCNFCHCLVKLPNLRMKMEISVLVRLLPNAEITLELSCPTTKRILEVPEGISQPKCNITDVLHKKIGPCVCLVESVKREENKTKFKLQEVILS